MKTKPILYLLGLFAAFSTVLLFAQPIGYESDLVADYRFEDSMENTLASGSPLANIGVGNVFATETVNGENRRVLQFPAGGGVLLGNLSSLLTNTGTYTVAIKFRFNTVSGYRKILDFKNRSLDSGFYCLSGNANFYDPSHTGAGTPIAAGEYVLAILSRDASTNSVRAFVNGEEQFMFTDSTSRAVADANDRWIFFQDDTATSGGEASAGAVAQIQIFDRALDTNEIEDFEFAEGSVENPPVAQDSAFTLAEGSFHPAAVSGTSEYGHPLTFSLVTGPERGTLTFHADGSYNYAAHRQPTLGFTSTDSFTFRANDGTADSNVATVTVTIVPVNSAPVAEDSAFTVVSGATYSGTVSATDADNDALTFSLVTGPSHGTLTLNQDGSFTYQAATAYTGTDTFTFRANDQLADSNLATVTVTITPPIPTVVLTFEGLKDNETVSQYYNGGLGGAGSGPGPNYDVSFSANGLALISSEAGGNGNFRNEPSPSTVLFFSSGAATTMNVPSGFQTGFSFYYVNSTHVQIRVYDGVDATGNLLATMDLPATPNPFTEFVPIGVTFSGTARSVDFAESATYCAFDNITLGSETPGNDAGLDAPDQLSPVDITPTQLVARWLPAPGADRYLFDVGLDENFNTYLDGYEKLDMAQTTQHLLAGLSPNTWYAIRVYAENESGRSPPSRTVWVPTGDNIPYPQNFPPDGPVSRGSVLSFQLFHLFHGTGMAYDAASSDSTVVSTSIDPQGFLRMEMLQPGQASITITATDPVTGYTASHVLTVEVVNDQPTVDRNVFAPREPWNMRFTQTVDIRNTSGMDAVGVRVLFSDLAPGISIENQTGVAWDGQPILDVATPFPADGVLSFNIVYLTTTVSPEEQPPTLAFQYILMDYRPPLPDIGTRISRQILLNDGTGRLVIEFESTPGAVYAVEYMNNFPSGTWTEVPLRLRAGGNRTQWIDSGPPATLPVEGARVYRVKQILEGGAK